MKLVWSEPSEKAKQRAQWSGSFSPAVGVCMNLRVLINCGLAESMEIFKRREINLDDYTEEQAMELIDLLDRNGCAPELV